MIDPTVVLAEVCFQLAGERNEARSRLAQLQGQVKILEEFNAKLQREVDILRKMFDEQAQKKAARRREGKAK